MSPYLADVSGVCVLLTTSLLVQVTAGAANPATGGEDDDLRNGDKRESNTAETKLVDRLLYHYRLHGTIARPVKNVGEPLDVSFGLRVINVEVIEKKQTLQLSVWCRITWYDETMKWDPSEYAGIKYISLPHDRIWTPGVDLANTADTKVEERSSLAQIRNDGKVFWTPHRVYRSACFIDITEFPYDQHTCELWLQSLGISSTQLNLMPYSYSSPFDLDTFIQSFKMSQEWDLMNNQTDRIARPKDIGATLMYSGRVALRFSITLRRRAGFRAYLVMVPCLLLSLMTCLIFCLPPERPDRNMLGMSLFASFVVLLLLMVEAAPPSAAAVPKLGYYYGCSLGLIISSVFCSAFVIFVSGRAEAGNHIPTPMRRVFVDWIGRILGLNWGKKRIKMQKFRESKRHHYLTDSADQEFLTLDSKLEEIHDYPDTEKGGGSTQPKWGSINESGSKEEKLLLRLDKKLNYVEQLIRTMNMRNGIVSTEQHYEILKSVKMEWITFSMVLDRLFFLLFLILNITSLVLFFPRKHYE